jgi:Predicted membrane protein (DUF2232)
MSADVMQTPQLTTGRLLLLGVSSVVLCVSFLMAVFAPFPLALAVIMYGRAKGILVGLAGLALSLSISIYLAQDLTVFGFYLTVLFFGLTIGEIALRNISPVKGVVATGLIYISLFAGLTGLYLKKENTTLAEMVKVQFEKNPTVLTQMERPDLFMAEFVTGLPSGLFIGVFFMLWFNAFLVLKSRRLLFSGNDYGHSEMDLLNFKAPFFLVFPVIVSLVLAIWGTDLGHPEWEGYGMLALKCLGVFYFFQGFGVFSALLNFVGLAGIFRSFIVVIVIFMANYLIAAAGLFDTWFDFRKYFVKRKTDD